MRLAALDAALLAAFEAAFEAALLAALEAAFDAARPAACKAALLAALEAALDAARLAAFDAARLAAFEEAWLAALEAAVEAARLVAFDTAEDGTVTLPDPLLTVARAVRLPIEFGAVVLVVRIPLAPIVGVIVVVELVELVLAGVLVMVLVLDVVFVVMLDVPAPAGLADVLIVGAEITFPDVIEVELGLAAEVLLGLLRLAGPTDAVTSLLVLVNVCALDAVAIAELLFVAVPELAAAAVAPPDPPRNAGLLIF